MVQSILASHGGIFNHKSLDLKEELVPEAMILITTIEAVPAKEA